MGIAALLVPTNAQVTLGGGVTRPILGRDGWQSASMRDVMSS
jgi:hypothetical protein